MRRYGRQIHHGQPVQERQDSRPTPQQVHVVRMAHETPGRSERRPAPNRRGYGRGCRDPSRAGSSDKPSASDYDCRARATRNRMSGPPRARRRTRKLRSRRAQDRPREARLQRKRHRSQAQNGREAAMPTARDGLRHHRRRRAKTRMPPRDPRSRKSPRGMPRLDRR